jgi:hypothetical protein
MLVVPLAAALFVGASQDDDAAADYRAVIVRGLVPDEATGEVSDLEIVLAGDEGQTTPVARIAADRLPGRSDAGSPQLSPSGRWLAMSIYSPGDPAEGHLIIDLEHPDADPVTLPGSGVSGWGPDDILWWSPNGPLQRVDPTSGTIETIDLELPEGLTAWPFEGWSLPVSADGSGVVLLDPEWGFIDDAQQPRWAVLSSSGLTTGGPGYPRLARGGQVRLLDEQNGLLQVCDSDPYASAYCPDQARGTVIATAPDGSVIRWRAAPPRDEFVLGASWAADGEMWVLVDRRSPEGRALGLVQVGRDLVETPGPAMAVAASGSISIEALAGDDSLIAVEYIDELGFHTALMDPDTGRSWAHLGQVAGFAGPAMTEAWPSQDFVTAPGEPLPAEPSAEHPGYPPMPPVSTYVAPLDLILLIHEAPPESGPQAPAPTILGPIAFEEGYGIVLDCSGPGDVRYRADDGTNNEEYVVHCQGDGPSDWSAPGVKGGSLTITVEPDVDTTWRLVVYDPPQYQSRRAMASASPVAE